MSEPSPDRAAPRATKRRLQAVLAVGPLLAAAFAAWLFAERGVTPFPLLWLALSLHQVEEYVLTEVVLGEEYFLLAWLERVGFALTPAQVLRLDVGLGWTAAAAAGYAGEAVPALGAFLIAVFAWNGAWHLSLTSHRREWSPGAVTSLLVYLPLCGAVLHRAARDDLLSPFAIAVLVWAAFLGHHLMLRSFPRSSGGAASGEAPPAPGG